MNKTLKLLSITIAIGVANIANSSQYSAPQPIENNEQANAHVNEHNPETCQNCQEIRRRVEKLYLSVDKIHGEIGFIDNDTKWQIKNNLVKLINTYRSLCSEWHEYQLVEYYKLNWYDLAIALLVAHDELDESTKDFIFKALRDPHRNPGIYTLEEIKKHLARSAYGNLNIVKETGYKRT